jgi:hypothetical protein
VKDVHEVLAFERVDYAEAMHPPRLRKERRGNEGRKKMRDIFARRTCASRHQVKRV